MQLALPVRHEWLTREREYGKILIEPFEPGHGLTVGNAYRRVLLSSIQGAAPTWVKIEGVLHEFSHTAGVTEDTLDIIMNLRKLVFTLHVNRPKLLRLRVPGPRTVTARDFEPDADVDVLTPDVELATLDKDGSLEMEVCVERGRGYQPAEKQEPEALPDQRHADGRRLLAGGARELCRGDRRWHARRAGARGPRSVDGRRGDARDGGG